MRIALIAVTEKGKRTAQRIAQQLPGSETIGAQRGVRQALYSAWAGYDGIVCIMAAGIVVRCLAGLCRTKYLDPCVVVVDENGDYSISLLSGHLGGGNDLAKQTADILGGVAVITTGSDVSGKTSIDLWSVENNLSIANPGVLASVAASLLNTGAVKLFQDREYVTEIPSDFVSVEHPEEADILVSLSQQPAAEKLLLIPRTRFIGCGCRKGTSLEDLQTALADLEKSCGIDLRSIAGIASIDLKKSETGLLELARKNDWPSLFYTKDELNGIVTPSRSEKVYDKVGVYNVCEAAALKAAGGTGPGRLIVRKIKWKNITMAVAEAAA